MLCCNMFADKLFVLFVCMLQVIILKLRQSVTVESVTVACKGVSMMSIAFDNRHIPPCLHHANTDDDSNLLR
jgi:hypothetical protein